MGKYVIDIPDEVKWIQYIQQTGHGTINLKVESVSDLTPYNEPSQKAIDLQHAHDIENVARMNYSKGAEDAWDFATSCIDMDGNDFYRCFEDDNIYYLTECTYSEAKAKYEEWRKEKDEIHVGDEVEAKPGNKACVLNENPDGTQVFVLKADGTTAWWSKCAVHKTEKNHPEVVELLKKMREE